MLAFPWQALGIIYALTLTMVATGPAQPHQHSAQSPAPPGQHAPADAEKPERDGMSPPMRGMMGHGGMTRHGGMMQRHLAQLTQQLHLSDEQRAQTQTLLRQHMKDVIRLRAELDAMALDLPPLLETEVVELPKVKQLVHDIAAKEADLRLAHITAMQDIRKLLTPEQQKQWRTMPGHMLGDGGMMGAGGGMEHGPIMGRGEPRESRRGRSERRERGERHDRDSSAQEGGR
ncbi:MAG: periplasmic heavy metal sensor [Candidatus Tectomicrobia bacterium]|uniref:Periplasmic heavy metal sensor n=1 Tax=Tectimicrobiota bacterium TaxID=2528274 RepID=A0A937VZ25_UNCTE|nr:periplasmic heavy metal sensor [Candidatus Tectomicrobia bacterium]